jgi:hypothetical protein
MSILLQLQRSNTTTRNERDATRITHDSFTPFTTRMKVHSAVQSRKRAGGSLLLNGCFCDIQDRLPGERGRLLPRMKNHGLLHPIRYRLNPKCHFFIQVILDSNPRPHVHPTRSNKTRFCVSCRSDNTPRDQSM